MGEGVARRHTCTCRVEDVEDVPAPRGLEVERGCGPPLPCALDMRIAFDCLREHLESQQATGQRWVRVSNAAPRAGRRANGVEGRQCRAQKVPGIAHAPAGQDLGGQGRGRKHNVSCGDWPSVRYMGHTHLVSSTISLRGSRVEDISHRCWWGACEALLVACQKSGRDCTRRRSRRAPRFHTP